MNEEKSKLISFSPTICTLANSSSWLSYSKQAGFPFSCEQEERRIEKKIKNRLKRLFIYWYIKFFNSIT